MGVMGVRRGGRKVARAAGDGVAVGCGGGVGESVAPWAGSVGTSAGLAGWQATAASATSRIAAISGQARGVGLFFWLIKYAGSAIFKHYSPELGCKSGNQFRNLSVLIAYT